MCRLLTRLYERAEEHADSIQDSHSLAAVLVQAGAMPPALLAALAAALAAEGLDGQFQVRQLHARVRNCVVLNKQLLRLLLPMCVPLLMPLLLSWCVPLLMQASMLELPSVMELVSLLDEPDPELLWMVRGSLLAPESWTSVGLRDAVHDSTVRQCCQTDRQCQVEAVGMVTSQGGLCLPSSKHASM